MRSTATKYAALNQYIDVRSGITPRQQIFVQGGAISEFNFNLWSFDFDKFSGNVQPDTGITFRTFYGRSNQNWISSGGTDSTKNRTWSWSYNRTPVGLRQNPNFGSYGQNYEFNFITGPPPSGQRLMEMNGTVEFSNGENFRHLNWQAVHNANSDTGPTPYPRAGEGRLLDNIYYSNTHNKRKWTWDLMQGNNTLTGDDNAKIVFTNASNAFYPISQAGVGLIRTDSAGYLDLGGNRMSLSLSTSTPEFVSKGGTGFGFGNAAYPVTNGALFYFGTGSEGFKMFRTGQTDTWNISKDANNLFFENGALRPFLVNKTAPNNSFTVASDGNIGFGTGSAPYKIYIANSTGNTGGALVGASGGTMTSGGAAVYYSNIGTTGSNWLYVLKGEMSVPQNMLRIS